MLPGDASGFAMHIQNNKQPLVQDNSNSAHPGATHADPDVFKSVLKDLSVALAEAAKSLEQTVLLHEDPAPKVQQGIDFYREVRRFKIALIRAALVHADGQQKRAAELLSIHLSTLNAMIKRYDIGIKPVIDSNKM